MEVPDQFCPYGTVSPLQLKSTDVPNIVKTYTSHQIDGSDDCLEFVDEKLNVPSNLLPPVHVDLTPSISELGTTICKPEQSTFLKTNDTSSVFPNPNNSTTTDKFPLDPPQISYKQSLFLQDFKTKLYNALRKEVAKLLGEKA